MTINEGNKFIYDNTSSEEFGVFLCDIGSINTDSNDEESQPITSTTSYRDTWDLHDVQKSSPLQFKITICKVNGDFINAEIERSLKKWLCKKKRCWLQIDQQDLSNIYYSCLIVNPQKISIGRYSGGMQFDVICDSGHAWSELKNKPYSSATTITFQFNNVTDYDEYELRPTLIITPLANGNISLKNNTTNTTVTVNNCVTTEVITLDGASSKVKSSNGRILIDSWNKKFLTMIDGLNSITLTGNFSLKLEYRLPIRVGG